MSQNVSEYLVQRLYDWGVRRIYGYPGDGINGVMGALRTARDPIDFVQVRHEEMAAFMACAHAKFTGQLGVCMATSGPGAVHLLNGLYDARMDHQPVVAIVGQQATIGLGGAFQQEIDLTTLYKDVASYVQQASTPAQIRHLVDRAVRIAISERTVTCVIIPNDVQEMAAEEPPRVHGATFSGIGFEAPRVVPTEADLRRAAEVLNSGERVAILIGAGAAGAGAEVQQVAELLGAGVAKALLGKAVLPDDLPYVTGSIGLLGTKPSWDMMMQCDTLLMVGSSFPYSEFLPPEGQARGVQIDLDPRLLSLRYPMEVPLCGDARETLRALLPLLRKKEERAWQTKLEAEIREWWEVLEARAMSAANPINPQRVFWELSPRLPERCILTCDSGSAANWYARDIRIREGMLASLSGNLATMGPGVPYSIAAKFAHPDRPVIAMVGDGAMQMNGMNELITIAKYWAEWSDPRLIILVLRNCDLNQVTWEQRVFSGDPKFEASQDLPPVPFAEYARLLGLEGIIMRSPEEVASGWEAALNARRPVVVEAHTDPDVPPLPPHITLEQAREFTSALLGQDPNLAGIVTQSVKQLADTYLRR